MSLRHRVRDALPRPLRTAITGVRHFSQRVGRWPLILRDVRGVTPEDQQTLWRSALLSPVHARRQLMKWQDPVLIRDAVVDVRGIGKFSLRGHSDDLWHVVPVRERAVLSAFHSLVRPGDVVVDAGANIGFYTVLASRLVGPKGRVIAIEMMPDTLSRLDDHLARNRVTNVDVVRHAISDVEGGTVVAAVVEGKFGQARIGAVDGGTTIEVPTTTLDAVCAAVPEIRLLKLDLEGVELAALRGAASTLRKTRHVVFERWASLGDGEGDPVCQLLMDAGFHLRRIDGNNWIATRR